MKKRIKSLIWKIKAIFCVLFGHSKIQHSCFGYFNCARCDAQLGDAIGGIYGAEDVVIVGHDCEKCRENYANCTWKDRFFAPNPFKKD